MKYLPNIIIYDATEKSTIKKGIRKIPNPMAKCPFLKPDSLITLCNFFIYLPYYFSVEIVDAIIFKDQSKKSN
jgi:hypothetical protein